MANKENLSPHTARQLQDNKSTPPTIASGSRVWQPSSSNSPSPGLLTPSSKPALRQQRDHSACRIQNSPLKVRKTRENLKQASLYADIPPPCVHGFHANGSDCHVQPGDSAAAYPRPDPRFARAQDEFSDASGSTLVGEASQVQVPRPLTPMGPSQTGKLLRHRSISRRVLTRVKEGISQRSRSSHTKTQDPDAILVRRFSGKRKESLEEQSRSRSFEVSRDSIDVQGYARTPEVEMSTPGRSFTDSSVATDDSNRSGFLHTPPQVRCTPPAHTRQYSGRLLTPELGTYSPSAEPTPRASARDIPSSLGREGTVLVTVPFVDLTISPDRESVDVGRSRDIWVAVEGTVRTRVVESNSVQPQEAQLRKSSMDAIIIIDQEVLQTAPKSTHKIIVELCSRLNVAGDRLAVLCAKVEHVGTRTTKCDCDELHALRTPSLSRLFERLSIAPSTVDTIFEEEWESLADSLQALSTRGLRKDLVQTFVISKTPTAILQLVDRQVPWPVHTFKIGLSSERTEFPSATIKLHNWAVEIHDDQEDIVDLLDNMIRDLRHGCSIGAVPSLRLCYKPLQGTSIIEVLGQKALKNVQLGQRCIMFLKVRIPRIDTSRASLPKDDIDQDSLFAELESIVGTLKTEYLHVEARYRNSVLPSDNVVNVRQICSIRRPKMDSRWSVTDSDKESSATDRVLGRLAYFLAANYPPTRALRMIDRWAVRRSASPSNVVQNIQRFLEFQASGASDLGDTTTGSQNDRPAVIITSTEIDAGENFSTAPNTPVGEATPRGASSLSIRPHDTESDPPTLQTSFLSTASAMPPTRTISAPRTTTAVTISSSGGATVSSTDGEDTARQVWRQMRRSSLSAKQLAEMTSENLQILEAGDGMLKAVRQQALMNKRSIGAETLRDLKWESLRGGGHGEAPWL